MRGLTPLPMVRRRSQTATQVCTLPERAPSAAAFYEPPPEDRDASAAGFAETQQDWPAAGRAGASE